jgi:general secretion pathway protein G
MKKKKRALTLLEIMIVIFLIGLIGGVMGYNMKGSLNEGKAFKSREGSAKIENLLNLQVANGWDIHKLVAEDPTKRKECLKSTHMVKDVDKLLIDGWGEPYSYKIVADQIEVFSKRLKTYEAAKAPQKER